MLSEDHTHETSLTRGQRSYLPHNMVAFGVVLQRHRELPALVELAKGGRFGRTLTESPCSRGPRHLVGHKAEHGNEEAGATLSNKQNESHAASESVVL